MAAKGLDKAEAEILNRILARVTTHAPPSGCDINALYKSWPNQAGRDYIDAIYRPQPIGALLSDDLILKKQWFLVTLPQVVTAEDAADLANRAKDAGKLKDFVIEERPDFFGLSRRQPTRLARFVTERLAPQLDEAAVACTVEFLVARAAVQEARRDQGLWPPAYIHPEQRHSIEVELVLLAQSSKAFAWNRDQGDRLVFQSSAFAQAQAQPKAADKPKKTDDKLAAAEKKIRQLSDEIKRLEALQASPSESELVGRFKRVYREHVLNFHPDKLTGRPETDRRVGEEVTRVLNALYQDIKM